MDNKSNINKFNKKNNSVFQQLRSSIKRDKNQKKVASQKKLKKKGNYILGETIGEGAFAKVKLAKHIYTGEKVAIKILNKEKINKSSDIQKIKKEITILQKLKHKNIIQLYEIMETNKCLYIIMEYCEGKELFDYISSKKHLSEKEACRYFQQIINGVEYLHLSKVTHRDLKPENLLLDNKKRILISDFGLSILSKDYNSLLTTPCGTPSYAPPEMLSGKQYNGIYSDIWSCGIILYTMLVGNLPCSESKEDLIYKNIITHNYFYPENLSDDAIDLIEHILKIKPEERYGFDEIKAHPWFNLITPKLRPGIVFRVHKVPIDQKILEKVEEYGYDKKKVEESVIKYRFDSFSAIYYLVLKQFKSNNINSISDLFSEDYLNYLKDYKNWINQTKINDPFFKDYEIELFPNFDEDEMLWSPQIDSLSNLSNDFQEFQEAENKTINTNIITFKENTDKINNQNNDNNQIEKKDKNISYKNDVEATFDRYVINDQLINDMEINFSNNYDNKTNNKNLQNKKFAETPKNKFNKTKLLKNAKNYKYQMTPKAIKYKINKKLQNPYPKRNQLNFINKKESQSKTNNINNFQTSTQKSTKNLAKTALKSVINNSESVKKNKINFNKHISLCDKIIFDNLNELDRESKILSDNSELFSDTDKTLKINSKEEEESKRSIKNIKKKIEISPLRQTIDNVLSLRRNDKHNFAESPLNKENNSGNYKIRIKRAKKKENKDIVLFTGELGNNKKKKLLKN